MSTSEGNNNDGNANVSGNQRIPSGSKSSEKGTILSPMPSSFLIDAHDTLYHPIDVLSLPKITQGLLPSSQPSQCILSGDPYSPEFLCTGPRINPIFHAEYPSNRKPTKRPRGSIKNNNSSFIHRGFVYEKLDESSKCSKCLLLVFYDKTIMLLDYGDRHKKIEPISKIVLTKAWPMCFELNKATASSQQLDVIIGTSTGDLLWLELVSQKYERINKHGNVTRSPVTAIAWVPNSESLVVAAHADGLIIVYDIQCEDRTGPIDNAKWDLHEDHDKSFHVILSLADSDSSDKKRSVKAIYRLTNKGVHISCLKFSSNSKLIVSSQDDYLKIFDLETESTTDLVPSLFAGIRVHALTPDKKYLALGGEDGIISLIDTQNFNLIVRLVGHQAWVKAMAFDEYNDYQQGYRLTSVGEDYRLLVWDFTPNTLYYPKWQPAVAIAPDELYGTEAHTFGSSNTLVHARYPSYKTPVAFPLAHIRPVIPEFGEHGLSDVRVTHQQLLAVTEDAKIWTWEKEFIRRD